MNNKKRRNTFLFVVGLILVFALSSITIYLAQRISTTPAPSAPESIPSAAVPDACQYSFTVQPLQCYSGSCVNSGQCATGLVCDEGLGLCVNADCRENSDCICEKDIEDEETPEVEQPTNSPTSSPLTQNIYSCDSTCSTDEQCKSVNSNYICYSVTQTCRHASYPQESSCQPPATASATSSPTTQPTATPTTSAKTVYSCDSSCSTNSQCQTTNANYVCNLDTNTCRHKDYPNQKNCTPPVTSLPQTATLPPDVPVSGVELPTILGIGAGVLLLIGALVLAL